ncbi:MAG TPA: hypothetical protein VMF63_13605, partial [Opitutaceae bacterium]|nr:hypothetical protein [Opitutaceae bacterium]
MSEFPPAGSGAGPPSPQACATDPIPSAKVAGPERAAGSKGSLAYALALTAALTAVYVMFHRQTHDVESLRLATEHLMRGETHWITFQNRILGPALIEGV